MAATSAIRSSRILPDASSTTCPAAVIFLVDVAELHAAGGNPELDISNQATVHLEDTSPVQIGTEGSPATVAAPAMNLWQHNLEAVRLLAEWDWLPIRTGAVQTITGVAYDA